jgi:hypothetical protein
MGPEPPPPRSSINPAYARGALVKVAGGRNQAEAEFIQNLLLEEGIPSMLKRSSGFDVPDMLAAGPRDVLVPSSGYASAREVLLHADLLAPAGSGVDAPGRILAGVLLAVALVGLIVWLGTEVVR